MPIFYYQKLLTGSLYYKDCDQQYKVKLTANLLMASLRGQHWGQYCATALLTTNDGIEWTLCLWMIPDWEKWLTC